MHNQTASVVSLAKTVRMGLDKSKEITALSTPTLELLLNTLIELGEGSNPTARRMDSAAAGYVASRITGVESR
jgi:hypothetical protein